MQYEPISVFDMLKIGVGPSSSHTLGPWRAAACFLKELQVRGALLQIVQIKVLLYGSLAKTGIGHGTDIAVQLGLCGLDPVTFDVNQIIPTVNQIAQKRKILLDRKMEVSFDPAKDLQFLYTQTLPYHPNGLCFIAVLNDGSNIVETYFSIGGGFVKKEGEEIVADTSVNLPFPIDTADDLLKWCIKTGLPISDIVYENEQAWRSESQINEDILKIWQVMKDCVQKGCNTTGILPGGLNVRRRAALLSQKLIGNTTVYNDYEEWVKSIQQGGNGFKYTLDWVSCFALAVNEENASFGRVVTAPTNGSAGVIPAVLHYYTIFCEGNNEDKIIKFLMTAAEIGSIFKKESTISAAMGGCQAEIGVSSSMAAAALTEALGGTQKQSLMAAEIAMEHHLGMTCDPVGGLVQIPCIERNTMGAIKAITASQLALQSTPDFARVSLDEVIKTMWETAQDMNNKYKETADGGLAINVPLSLPEC